MRKLDLGDLSIAETAIQQRKPMDLNRLEEWMEIKKRLEQQKKDEDDE